MSFSSDVKEELKTQVSPARHCCIAEFAALFALAGQVKRFQNGNVYMKIHTENLTVAQKSYILLRKTFHAKIETTVRSHNPQAGTGSFSVFVFRKNDVINILKAVKIIDEQKKQWGNFLCVHHMVVQNTCCKRAFLRGVFMAAGSVTNPEKAYHLELAVLSEELAGQIREIISSFMIDAKIARRKKYYVVYIKRKFTDSGFS